MWADSDDVEGPEDVGRAVPARIAMKMLDAMASALIRVCSNELGRCMHDGLMQIFDHAVVAAVDMDGNFCNLPSAAAVESRQGDSPQTIVSRPLQCARMLGDRPDEEMAINTSPGLDWARS